MHIQIKWYILWILQIYLYLIYNIVIYLIYVLFGYSTVKLNKTKLTFPIFQLRKRAMKLFKSMYFSFSHVLFYLGPQVSQVRLYWRLGAWRPGHHLQLQTSDL